MRVLHLIPQLSGGGTECQLGILASEMAKTGHDVHIGYLKEGPETITIPGVVFHQIGMFGNYDPGLLFRLHRLVRRVRPDIIQSWIVMMDIVVGLLSLAHQAKWVIREPTSAVAYSKFSFKRWLRTKLARRASSIVSNSLGGKSYWLTQDIPEHRLTVIPNAVPFDDVNSVKPAHKVSTNQKLLIYAGRLIPSKNVDIIINAIANIRQRHSLRFIIAGEGPAKRNLMRLVADLKLSEVVRFVGFLQSRDLWAQMKAADLFVSVSEFEGMPNAVTEAVACGVPLVVSDIPAHRSFLDDESAILISHDSVTEVAESICHALEYKLESVERAAKALETIKDRAPEMVACEYIRLYEKLLR